MIIRLDTNEKLTEKEILDYIDQWENSAEYTQLNTYYNYYTLENEAITEKVDERSTRNVKPNNKVPTAYFATQTNNICSYFLGDIQVTARDDKDKEEIELLLEVLEQNRADEKNMKAGIQAVAYERAIEYIYTVGETAEIRFSNLPPLEVTLIYNSDIEPVLFCGIWKRKISEATEAGTTKANYLIDVIYKDAIQSYTNEEKSGKLILQNEKPLFFKTGVPLAVYHTQIIGSKSPMHSIIAFQDELDSVLSGNSNELDKHAEAILLATKIFTEEEKERLSEVKVIDNLEKGDLVEYLTKDMKPEFKIFVAEMLITQISTHSHVINWYDKELGLGTATSAEALRLRLFDMENISKMMEKVIVNGFRERNMYIAELLQMKNLGTLDIDVNIVFNRNLPSDFNGLVTALKDVPWISSETKQEKVGIDPEQEKTRLDEEKINNVEDSDTEDLITGEPTEQQTQGIAEVEKELVLNGAQIASALSIVGQMNQGLIDRETAINMIMTFFSMSREKALLVVGKKKNIPPEANV